MTKVIGLDLETTGLDVAKGHAIIEVGMLMYELETGKLLDKFVRRVNPMRPIDAKAQEIHGIAYSDVVSCPVFKDLAPAIISFMKQADFLVAHNADFDMPFIGIELMRAELEIPEMHTVCTMKEGRWATPLGKNPNLGELCFALEIEYDKSKAHSAEYDIDVTMQCFFKGLERGFYKVPELKQLEREAA